MERGKKYMLINLILQISFTSHFKYTLFSIIPIGFIYLLIGFMLKPKFKVSRIN